jgi:hypothetical protein
MRSIRRARWLFCAIALSTLAPNAVADDQTSKKKKSVEKCASFDQKEVEDGLELSIESSCAPKLACSIKWAVTCAPDTKREKKTWGGAAFELEDGQSDFATASASVCEDDSWAIGSITWSCDPM